MLNPLVMKSALFPGAALCSDLLNKLLTLSFCAIFLRLFLSSCSCSTFLVSEAVALFLMPSLVGVGVAIVVGFDVAFSFFVFVFLSSSEEEEVGFVEVLVSCASPLVVTAPLSACLRFFLLLPGAFFSACVRPFSLSVFKRRLRRAMSVGAVGRIGMTSFSAYGSLHCIYELEAVRTCSTSS